MEFLVFEDVLFPLCDALLTVTDRFASHIHIFHPYPHHDTGLATKLKESGLSAPDFLASIELLIVDNADVIAMQNWSHLQTVLDAINMIPKKHTDVDVMRVRENHLEGLAKHHRQTVFLSSYQSPEINALSRTCHNVAGRIKYRVNNYPGVLGRATAANGSSRLRFDRIPDVVVGVDEQSNQSGEGSKNLVALSDDARFKHFYKFTLPRLRENPRAGTVVFIPSYFDFVRVRNLLTETELSFAVASEYTPPRDAARARTIFADGRKRVLLVTERAHFYHRRKVKGVREVVFYGPPEHPEYFAEFVEFAASNTSGSGSNNSETTATCAFAKLDGLRLERIVGTQRAKKMLAPDANSAFVFTA
ncbi:def/UTP25 family protein [bacterium]|nr:def/UTP25 family protein [bacterium]